MQVYSELHPWFWGKKYDLNINNVIDNLTLYYLEASPTMFNEIYFHIKLAAFAN